MTFLQKLKILIGRNLISSATGRWYPKYPPEAYFHNCMSFSQCGEDLAVVNILMQLGHQGPVNYVDIGCFHPIKYSNSYFFYLREGSGLVVDMNDSHRSEFERMRPRDKFLSEIISDSSQPRHPRALSAILDEYWTENKQINFLDIDCEGHDLEVLRSNNWEIYRPMLVVCEIIEKNLSNESNQIDFFMQSHNYERVSKLRMANFYFDKRLCSRKQKI
jgi:hypothetical protein